MSQLDVMAQSVAAIAPSAAAATTPALIAIYAGHGTWLSYVAATVVVLLVGLVATKFGRRFASSGSLYSYVARGPGTQRRVRRGVGPGHRLHVHLDDRRRRHQHLLLELPRAPSG